MAVYGLCMAVWLCGCVAVCVLACGWGWCGASVVSWLSGVVGAARGGVGLLFEIWIVDASILQTRSCVGGSVRVCLFVCRRVLV